MLHDPAEICCTTCYAGKASANTKENAHQNLEVFPGRMQTVEQSCGQSGRHAELIPLVQNSRMNTLDGMLPERVGYLVKNRKSKAIQI